MFPNKYRFFYWLLVLAYCGFIFFLSSRPSLGVSHDKTAHVMEYALLGFFIAAALRHFFQPKLVLLILFTVLLGTLYGISDEIHQSFVPGRTCSGWDVLADFFGSTMGALIYVAYSRLQRPSPANP